MEPKLALKQQKRHLTPNKATVEIGRLLLFNPPSHCGFPLNISSAIKFWRYSVTECNADCFAHYPHHETERPSFFRLASRVCMLENRHIADCRLHDHYDDLHCFIIARDQEVNRGYRYPSHRVTSLFVFATLPI